MIAFDPDTGETVHFCEDQYHYNAALSPDGQTLVMIEWGTDILTAPVSDPCDTTVLSTDGPDLTPTQTIWTPDGSSIIFTDNVNPRTIMSVPAAGGTTTVVRESGFSPSPSPDGTLLGFIDWDSRHVHTAAMDGSNPVDLFAQWGVEGSAGALSWHSRGAEPAAPVMPVPSSSAIGMLTLLLLLGMFGLIAVRRSI